MATSQRVRISAAFSSFYSIFIATLAILYLLSIASVAALPHVPFHGVLGKDESSSFSRRDDGLPSYQHRRPELWRDIDGMTTRYPQVRVEKVTTKAKDKEGNQVKWTFGPKRHRKALLLAPYHANRKSKSAMLQDKLKVWQPEEKRSIRTIPAQEGLLWSTLHESAASEFILDMDLIYTNQDCEVEWWAVTPVLDALETVLDQRGENIPLANRILRTLDVIEGIARMHTQKISYFFLSTSSVAVIMKDEKKVPPKFKGKEWIKRLQLNRFDFASDIEQYSPEHPPLTLTFRPNLDYYRSPEMQDISAGFSEANDVWAVGVFILSFLLGPNQKENIAYVCSRLQERAVIGKPKPALRYLRRKNVEYKWKLSKDLLTLLAKVLAAAVDRINIEELRDGWKKLPEYRAAAPLEASKWYKDIISGHATTR